MGRMTDKSRGGAGGWGEGDGWPGPSPLELLERAREAASRAYAPYSRFRVGLRCSLRMGGS